MEHDDEQIEGVQAELERVLGETSGDDLYSAGGPLTGGMPEFLELLKSLPSGAGVAGLTRALGERETLFGKRGAQN